MLWYIIIGDNMRVIKRKRFSIKKTLRLVIPFIILLVLIINIKKIIIFTESKVTGYTYETTEVFNELDIYNDVKKHKYSLTLDKVIQTDSFNKKYLKDYLDIVYTQNDDNFIENINGLLDIGYNSADINKIYEILSLDSINTLLDNNYFGYIFNVLNLNYFHEDLLLRYMDYAQNNDNLVYQDVVTYVNIGLDHDYYNDIIKIEEPDDTLVLVNKYHSLGSNYVPKDLEAISSKYNMGSNNKLRHEARLAFEEMCEAALKDNIKIYSGSAYRSYSYQANLYNRYVNADGKKKADTYSARAGSSEHQTGLATDILNARLDFISANDKEYTWLIDNSYKYGFILRYPLNKENITGYMYEEWHYRYVGKSVAKELHDTGITYDEYIART